MNDPYLQDLAGGTWRGKSRTVRQRDRYCGKCGTAQDLTAQHRSYARGQNATLADLHALCRTCNKLEDDLNKAMGEKRRDTSDAEFMVDHPYISYTLRVVARFTGGQSGYGDRRNYWFRNGNRESGSVNTDLRENGMLQDISGLPAFPLLPRVARSQWNRGEFSPGDHSDYQVYVIGTETGKYGISQYRYVDGTGITGLIYPDRIAVPLMARLFCALPAYRSADMAQVIGKIVHIERKVHSHEHERYHRRQADARS